MRSGCPTWKLEASDAPFQKVFLTIFLLLWFLKCIEHFLIYMYVLLTGIEIAEMFFYDSEAFWDMQTRWFWDYSSWAEFVRVYSVISYRLCQELCEQVPLWACPPCFVSLSTGMKSSSPVTVTPKLNSSRMSPHGSFDAMGSCGLPHPLLTPTVNFPK